MHRKAIAITRIPTLVIAHFADADYEMLPGYMNDPVICETTVSIPSPYKHSDAEEFRKKNETFFEEHGVVKDFAIVYEQKFAGGIGLMYNYGIDSHKSELGYWLGAEFRGRGLMSEVLRAFVNHVFTSTEIARLEAQVFEPNRASQRVLEKCGFLKEAHFRASIFKDGSYFNTLMYAILKPGLHIQDG